MPLMVVLKPVSYKQRRYGRGAVIDVTRQWERVLVKTGHLDYHTGAMEPEDEPRREVPTTPRREAEPARFGLSTADEDRTDNENDEDEDIDEVREHYRRLTGDRPDGRWSVKRIQAEILKMGGNE